MFARKCAASSPLWSLATAVVLQAKNSALILRAESWISEAETQVVSRIPLPATTQIYIYLEKDWKKTSLYLNEPSTQIAAGIEDRGLMSDASYGPYFSQ